MEWAVGPALDAEIAKRLFNWRHVYDDSHPVVFNWWEVPADDPHYGEYHGMGMDPPEYSTNIAEAWPALEWTHRRGWALYVGRNLAGQWECSGWLRVNVSIEVCERAATAPLAICLAALKAVGATRDAD